VTLPRPPNSGETLWSEALVARLSELWLSGTASGEISRRFGISRSSVMGKLRRLGLLRRDRPGVPTYTARQLRAIPVPKPRPEKRPNKRNKQPVTEPVTPPLPPSPPPEPEYGTLNLLDLRHNSCRWPEGDGPIFVFCGRPRHHESSYCEDHTKRSLSGLARGVPYVGQRMARS